MNYTPDGGTITVELHSDVNNVRLDVSDTGIGIERDDLPHIFERFYRADKTRTERGRSGLGLAITQKVIDVHQGHIEVVKLLLKAKADVNLATADGWTPLFMASQEGHTRVVKLLLDERADVNIKADLNGKLSTALKSAKKNGHADVVSLLEKYGAKE